MCWIGVPPGRRALAANIEIKYPLPRPIIKIISHAILAAVLLLVLAVLTCSISAYFREPESEAPLIPRLGCVVPDIPAQ